MSLNIKNEEAHRLARELAQITGESLTVAVTRALRERLERAASKKQTSERLLQIGRSCSVHLSQDVRTLDHGEMLYDSNGLPQ